MEPKFQSSFIPKNPVVSAPGSSSVAPIHTRNIFSIIATVLFVITLLISVGLYFYTSYITGQIATDDASLTATRNQFQPDKIQELISANSRIVSTKNLLEKHVVLSSLLTLLSQLAVKNIQFGTLLYSVKATVPTVSVDLSANGYNALAAQEALFSQSPSLTNVAFSDFALGDSGTVKMNFFADVVPTLVSYKSIIQGTTGTAGGATAPAAPVATSSVQSVSTTTKATP